MQLHPVFQRYRNMPFVISAAPQSGFGGRERQFGKDGDAVIAFLSCNQGMLIAQLRKSFEGKVMVDYLGFLQAENIRLVTGDELLHMVKAGADGVDVPGG